MANVGPEVERQLSRFIDDSEFQSRGAVITDLDGTAVHEIQGQTLISKSVESSLTSLYASGHPLVLNSLRFPLSILQAFGKEWYEITDAPVPVVALNGSVIGVIDRLGNGAMCFEEREAYPLTDQELEALLHEIGKLAEIESATLLVFYYPRDWRVGEVIWTPIPERISDVKNKYVSASSVSAIELPKLHEQMVREEICMVHLQFDLPEDRRMAYQHTQPAAFLSRRGVTKLSGAQRAAELFGFALEQSLGAGDTEMDTFLSGCGLAILVGGISPDYRGIYGSLRVSDPPELGDALSRLSELLREKVQ